MKRMFTVCLLVSLVTTLVSSAAFADQKPIWVGGTSLKARPFDQKPIWIEQQ